MTIEELFGTLQMSVVAGWRKHLKTAKYGKHKALQDFYEEMPDLVDALIEGWMGAHGKKVGAFQNILSSSNLNTLKYLNELKRVCKEGKTLMGENEELISLIDDIINLINSTLYKVKELNENNMKRSMTNFKDFIIERLETTNESKKEPIFGLFEMAYTLFETDDESLEPGEVRECWDTFKEMMNVGVKLSSRFPGVSLELKNNVGVIFHGVTEKNFLEFFEQFYDWFNNDFGYYLDSYIIAPLFRGVAKERDINMVVKSYKFPRN